MGQMASDRDLAQQANIADVQEYIDLLYDDEVYKIKGSQKILLLCQNAQNLPVLSQNENLFSALSRSLREDCQTSLQLAQIIVDIFHCFCVSSKYRHLLVSHKVFDSEKKLLKTLERKWGKQEKACDGNKKLSS